MHVYLLKLFKYHHIIKSIFAGYGKCSYLCIVFFMVLDY